MTDVRALSPLVGQLQSSPLVGRHVVHAATTTLVVWKGGLVGKCYFAGRRVRPVRAQAGQANILVVQYVGRTKTNP